MEPIQITGIKDLDEMEIESVNRLANRYYSKIQREIKNITSLTVHIKSYEKQGREKKYSVHVKVIAPTRIFVSTKTSDWDLEKALHKSFRDVIREMQHSLHTDDQHKKGR
ncbi:MAG: hypothetical protein QF798_02265 [Candidatus Woesearchaeota archaeon]|jgi:hypothetical protein|nr:hypothetical protein [Candidatus Woesearchaeota archaeon]MDP6600239.1 hypothetical protein [Candidatus Woesearchaeota archaeon]|tara:strand:+ start:1191 stop:1520 length:330 start_codon:yes stop_codon:yes gene_type:complete